MKVVSPGTELDWTGLLQEVLEGKRTIEFFSELLIKHGHFPSPRPNHTLAEFMGTLLRAAHAQHPKQVVGMLEAWARTPAESFTSDAFMPFVAAYGFIALFDLAVLDEKTRQHFANEFLELADDSRGVVREAVCMAWRTSFLNQVKRGNLKERVKHWNERVETDGRLFVKSAFWESLAHTKLLTTGLMDEALFGSLDGLLQTFATLPRGMARHPAVRKIEEIMPSCVFVLITESAKGEEWLAKWVKQEEVPLRHVLEEMFDKHKKKPKGRITKGEWQRLEESFRLHKKAPRNPRHNERPTRHRSR